MMTLVAVGSLLLLFVTVVRKLRWWSVIHPATWFGAAWVSALLAYWMLDAIGGVPVHDTALLNQLMTFVIFTSLVFVCLIAISERPRTKTHGPMWSGVPFHIHHPLKVFATVGLLGAFLNWVVLGGNITYQDALRQQWLEGIPVITTRLWYLYVFSVPAAIASGWIFSGGVLRGVKPSRSLILFMLMPALAGVLWSLGTGGRQAFGLLLLHYMVGGALGWATGPHGAVAALRRRMLKMALVMTSLVVVFSLFVGLTGSARAKQQGAEASSFDSIWYLAPVGQFLSYMGLAVATHQAYGNPERRDLSETGPVSLAGLQDFGLRYMTGARAVTTDDTNPERRLASSGLPLASGTRNLFYDLQADFGFDGALAACAVLVVVSHLLFLWRIKTTQTLMLSVAPLGMSLMFWGYSHQLSLLMYDTFYWLVFSCALADFFSLLSRAASARSLRASSIS